MALRRFWFEFDASFDDDSSPGIAYGCGVTARDYEDAIQIVKDRVFQGEPMRRILRTIEDVDVSELDAGHVLPNMHPPISRGVWFPLGYEE